MIFDKLLIYTVVYFSLFTATFFFLTFFENRKYLKNPKVKIFPKVTIAVPAYNEEKTIAKTLRSLLKLDYPKNKLELFVIDDGSSDKTYKIAKKFEKFGIKVFTKKNTGKGDSLNFALKHATGKFFVSLDADSFVAKDALKKMVGYFNDEKVMAVTPSLKIYKPKTWLQKLQSIEYLMGVYLRKVFSYLDSIHVTPGPFTIYRKKFFDKYGGYDAYNLTEDIEIALRIQSKRYTIENAMDACVFTVSPSTFKTLLTQRKRWYLGFLNNVIDYKHLFHYSYGNMGLFILPASFLSVLFVLLLIGYSSFKVITNLYAMLLDLIAINFDITPFLKLRFDTFFLNLDPIMILTFISLAVGIATICLAKKFSNEKASIKASYALYLIAYGLMFAFWWVVAGVTKVTKSKVSWGKKSF